MRLIDADTLWRVFEDTTWWDNSDRGEAQSLLEDAPTIDAMPVVHAKWRYELYPTVWYGGGSPPEYVCSHCEDRAYNTYDFCPNCGALMDEK